MVAGRRDFRPMKTRTLQSCRILYKFGSWVRLSKSRTRDLSAPEDSKSPLRVHFTYGPVGGRPPRAFCFLPVNLLPRIPFGTLHKPPRLNVLSVSVLFPFCRKTTLRTRDNRIVCRVPRKRRVCFKKKSIRLVLNCRVDTTNVLLSAMYLYGFRCPGSGNATCTYWRWAYSRIPTTSVSSHCTRTGPTSGLSESRRRRSKTRGRTNVKWAPNRKSAKGSSWT